MEAQLRELLKQHGLTDVLGALVKEYGNNVLCAEMDGHSPEEVQQAKAMAHTLTACWQYALKYAPELKNAG